MLDDGNSGMDEGWKQSFATDEPGKNTDVTSEKWKFGIQVRISSSELNHGAGLHLRQHGDNVI